MSINITVNNSPYAGLEGQKVTSNQIRKRLLAEVETNVAITFKENDSRDSFEIGEVVAWIFNNEMGGYRMK